MKSIEIAKDIFWVGGIDWSLRNFHGYKTQRGSTYNAYIIIDEKITLIDTVKDYMSDEFLSRLSSVIDPSKIDYVVVNHVEMDHSGAVPHIMELAPNATIVTCASGEKGLREHYKKDWNFHVVKTGDSLSLGKRTLNFVTTPMVHWPDNMVSYMPEEKILFSNDAFGQHLASSERFDDEFPLDIILEEAKKYYANIVFPYGTQASKALDDTQSLEIKMIAPSHGIIWRKNLAAIHHCYDKWAHNRLEKKVVIAYDSMWGSTEKMAKAVYKAFEQKGYKLRIFDLKLTDISDIMTEILDAEYLCVGSPTLNSGIMPNVAAFLTYVQGLAPKNRKGIIFGSYGWAQRNVKVLEEYFEKTKIQIVHSHVVNYIPTEENLLEMQKKIEDVI